MIAKYHDMFLGCFVAQINDAGQSHLISLKAEDSPVRISIMNALSSEISKRI